MTMPNPAAEVVSRLREAADNIERARMSGIVENLAGWEQRAVREAAECIAHLNAERLSRERDTGVPEGFWLAPIRPTDEIMTAAAEAHFGKRRTAQSGGIDGIGMTVDGRDLSFRDAFKSFWKGARSAAPQPPTVSTQGWQEHPADSAFDAFSGQFDLESNAWLDMDLKSVWRAGWEAASETLTRERDQAREALRAAREFAVKALAELVELDDFDPSEHQLVKQIDGALAAVPAPEASDG